MLLPRLNSLFHPPPPSQPQPPLGLGEPGQVWGRNGSRGGMTGPQRALVPY